MKLAKKMLAGVLALAMVAALALTAFAAAPAINMTATKAVVGQEMTVTVSGKNIVGLNSADLFFGYDPEVLELVSVKKAYPDFDMAVGGQVKGSNNEASFSFAYMEATTEDTDFCTITFKVLKAGNTEVTLTVGSWEGIDLPAKDATKPLKVVVTDPNATTETTTEKATETTTVATEATSKVPETDDKIPQTGEAGVAAIAGVMVLAAVAFVATRKKDEE